MSEPGDDGAISRQASAAAGAASFSAPPPEAPLLARLRAGIRAYRGLRRDVTDPAYGLFFLESFDGKTYARLAGQHSCDPATRRLIDERPSLQAADISALADLPAGSVGREYARWFESGRLQPLPPAPAGQTPAQFLCRRMRACHDLHHLLTGYATDLLGEHELQAFQYGNVGTPSSLFALLAGLRKRGGIGRLAYLRRLWRAWRRGRAAAPLPLIVWEEHWRTPLEQLRERLLRASPGPAHG